MVEHCMMKHNLIATLLLLKKRSKISELKIKSSTGLTCVVTCHVSALDKTFISEWQFSSDGVHTVTPIRKLVLFFGATTSPQFSLSLAF